MLSFKAVAYTDSAVGEQVSCLSKIFRLKTGRLTSQQTEKDDRVCGVTHKESKIPQYTAGKNKAFA